MTDRPETTYRETDRRPRRHPIYSRFILTGAVLGFLLAALVAAQEPGSAMYSQGRATMFFGVLGLMIGALLGAIVALLLDRRR